MSPSRSNTICVPSGLTSTFIHVPSLVSKASVVVGPVGSATSHFFASCWASCWAPAPQQRPCRSQPGGSDAAPDNGERDQIPAGHLECSPWSHMLLRSGRIYCAHDRHRYCMHTYTLARRLLRWTVWLAAAIVLIVATVVVGAAVDARYRLPDLQVWHQQRPAERNPRRRHRRTVHARRLPQAGAAGLRRGPHRRRGRTASAAGHTPRIATSAPAGRARPGSIATTTGRSRSSRRRSAAGRSSSTA